jgi:hypothetical protein
MTNSAKILLRMLLFFVGLFILFGLLYLFTKDDTYIGPVVLVFASGGSFTFLAFLVALVLGSLTKK